MVNVGDDMVLHGLHISPDIDTIIYTLAGAVSAERGWGLEGETWSAMEMLSRYGGQDWFSLGDRDLGTHLFRTQCLSEGVPLSRITATMAISWGLELAVVPATDDRVETMLRLVDGDEIAFQDYFVRHGHGVEVTSVRFRGADTAELSPAAALALDRADLVIIAPSNPVVSIDPILAIPGVTDRLQARRDSVVAVSPIVGGKALKGPADRLLRELGHEVSALGVARWYQDLAATIVIDEADETDRDRIGELGMTALVTDTIMADRERSEALARFILDSTPTGADRDDTPTGADRDGGR